MMHASISIHEFLKVVPFFLFPMKGYKYMFNLSIGTGMEKKVKLLVSIPESLDRKLRRLIAQKYEKYEKGLLSYEVELAIRNWLALHTNAQTPLQKPNPVPKVALAFAQVKDYLLTNYYETLQPGQQINLKHLEKAIMETRGSDPRTVKKWLRLFVDFKLVKPIVGNVWEVIG